MAMNLQPDSRGLDPVIHGQQRHASKTWMPGASPGMTMLNCQAIE
jgi:hypothetical protein